MLSSLPHATNELVRWEIPLHGLIPFGGAGFVTRPLSI